MYFFLLPFRGLVGLARVLICGPVRPMDTVKVIKGAKDWNRLDGVPHREVGVDGRRGCASYSHHGAEDVGPASHVRILADIVKAMSLFDFKRKFLKKTKKNKKE